MATGPEHGVVLPSLNVTEPVLLGLMVLGKLALTVAVKVTLWP
jgi:hypothetical protein